MEYNKDSYKIFVKIERFSFQIVWFLFARFTPPQMNFWRCIILKIWGAKISNGAMVYGSVKIWLPRNLRLLCNSCLAPYVDCYNVAPIIIGCRTVISQKTFLCTASHCYWKKGFDLYSKTITVGNNSWLAAECFVGPGTSIPNNSVYFARSIITRSSNIPSEKRYSE